MRFSEILVNERKKRGWSQETLAQKLSVSRQSISKWETDQAFPDLPKLIQLSELLEISLDELCGKKERIEPNNKHPFDYKLLILLISVLFIGLFIGSKISSNQSLSDKNIEVASVNVECGTGEGITIYVTPSYIHKSATYNIVLTPCSYRMDYESKKGFLKDNIFSASFSPKPNLKYDISLEIKAKNETIILPLYQNFEAHNNGYGYSWSAEK